MSQNGTDPELEPEVVVVPPVARRRRAFVCSAKDCNRRVFLRQNEVGPAKCKDHPGAPMVIQPNAAYSPNSKLA